MLNPTKLASKNYLSSLDTSREEFLHILELAKNFKNKHFKLVIKGELSLELLHSFVSLDINRVGNSLQLINYEVIEKNLSKNN